jgi:hypothetical protein
MVGTRNTTWACGQFGKVPCLWNEIVDGLKRYPEYGLGCG